MGKNVRQCRALVSGCPSSRRQIIPMHYGLDGYVPAHAQPDNRQPVWVTKAAGISQLEDSLPAGVAGQPWGRGGKREEDQAVAATPAQLFPID